MTSNPESASPSDEHPDRAGHVVGVMTVWFQPRMQGEKDLEAGGEDAASIYRSVERQR